MRVRKRSDASVEEKVITSGSPVAIVAMAEGTICFWTRYGLAHKQVSTAEDCVIVRSLCRFSQGPWALIGSGTAVFATEQLDASSLDSAT
jgi:hypothetical protein